jgi:hypothetical protein
MPTPKPIRKKEKTSEEKHRKIYKEAIPNKDQRKAHAKQSIENKTKAFAGKISKEKIKRSVKKYMK